MDARGPLSPEDFQRWVRVSNPAIDPMARWVAWTESAFGDDQKLERNVVVAAAEGGTPPRRLTADGSSGEVAWAPDGSRMAWFSESDGPRLVVATPDGRVLSDRPVTGSPRRPSWSPDSRWITWEYLTAEVDPLAPRRLTRVRYQVNGVGFLGDRTWQVGVALADGSGAVRVVSDSDYHHFCPAWSPDSRRLALVTTRRPDWDVEWVWDVFTVDVDGANWTCLTPSDGVSLFPVWSPDGRRIAFLHNHAAWTGSTMDYHVRMVPADGVGAPACLTHALDRGSADTFEPPLIAGAAPVFSPDGATVLWLMNQGGRHVLMRSGEEDSHDAVQWDVGWPSVDAAGTLAAVLDHAADRPPRPALLNLTDGTRTVLHDPNAWLTDRALATPSHWTVPSPDGPVTAWVWTRSDRARPVPLLLNFHGGPHGAFGPYFSFTQQILASHGYAVAAINYRGSAGFGQAFADLVHGNWGPKEGEDGIRFIDTLAEARVADPARVGVFGPSYGGFMTLWMVTQHPERVHAGVGQSVLSHLATSVYSIEHWESGRTDMAGAPWERTDYYRTNSPITQVDRVTAPLLLLHGEEDLTCRLIEAEMMFVGLRWQGKPVELVRYPEESHGFHRAGRLRTLWDSHRRMLDWFDRYLLGKRGTS